MRGRCFGIVLLLLLWMPAAAHRLDEYLQATLLSIEPGRVQATIRLVPGVAVAPAVIALMDSNRDGRLSQEEQQSYAGAVLADLQLEDDGQRLPVHLVSANFPSLDRMRQGTGEIEIAFSADLPTRGDHRLTFTNRHQRGLSVYLVNSLVPKDNDLSLTGQYRNRDQSIYEVSCARKTRALSRAVSFSGFSGAFRLGARHILDGTDHILFLLTLLLPAPLLAVAGRWSGIASLGRSLTHMFRIVTAFTVGHSLTLAASGLGIVRLPSRPVEVLIAFSILVSARHAMRPIFPGREAVVAAAFGLIHGLAFASALNELGYTGWYRVVSLFGFNIGIEAMQLMVVAVALPALLIVSRTAYYRVFRIVGAAIASVAACAWIAERVLGRSNMMASGVERIAHYGVLLSAGLWLCSAVAWLLPRVDRDLPSTAPRRCAGAGLRYGRSGEVP